MNPKSILQSKTFWTNLLAPGFLWASTRYGLNLDPEAQTVIIFLTMTIANIGLRRMAHEHVRFALPKKTPPPLGEHHD